MANNTQNLRDLKYGRAQSVERHIPLSSTVDSPPIWRADRATAGPATNFTMLPNRAMEAVALGAIHRDAIVVLAVLCNCRDYRTNMAVVGQRELARRAGLADSRTVKRAVEALQVLGVVTTLASSRERGHGRTRYLIHFETTAPSSDVQGGLTASRPPNRKGSPGGARGASHDGELVDAIHQTGVSRTPVGDTAGGSGPSDWCTTSSTYERDTRETSKRIDAQTRSGETTPLRKRQRGYLPQAAEAQSVNADDTQQYPTAASVARSSPASKTASNGREAFCKEQTGERGLTPHPSFASGRVTSSGWSAMTPSLGTSQFAAELKKHFPCAAESDVALSMQCLSGFGLEAIEEVIATHRLELGAKVYRPSPKRLAELASGVVARKALESVRINGETSPERREREVNEEERRREQRVNARVVARLDESRLDALLPVAVASLPPEQQRLIPMARAMEFKSVQAAVVDLLRTERTRRRMAMKRLSQPMPMLMSLARTG